MARRRRAPHGLQDLVFARALAGRNTNVIMPREYLFWRAKGNILGVLACIAAAVLAFPLAAIYFGLGFQGDPMEVLIGMWFAQVAIFIAIGASIVVVQFTGFIMRLIFGR